jgi:uncharacterized membrane protein YoaK (UPF0700 family)
MFRHEGSARSDRQNRLVAGYLAFIGGFVNSAGFVLVGAFTSHVTGNVGRLANDLASNQASAAGAALSMIGAFLFGAFVASMGIESGAFGRKANAYCAALACEALLLAVFTIDSALLPPHVGGMDAAILAAILCAAMGMQNSLVTRLSGAVVRTTHLTGVVTDIGIEGARWFRWWRGLLSEALHVPLAFGRDAPVRPSNAKIALLATIGLAFTCGAVLGGALGVRFHYAAMILPTLGVAMSAAYAFVNGRKEESVVQSPDTRR